MLGPVLAIAATGWAITRGLNDDALIMAGVAVLVTVVTLLCVYPCRYTIHADHLAIRCGVVFYRVGWDDVVDVRPSRSWLSGPALSLRRVIVATRQKHHIVSPVDREQFIEDVRRFIR